MRDKNKKSILKSDNDKILDANVAVSSTDCTGLIQTQPLSKAEAESYNEICDIPQQKVDADDGRHHK